MDQTAQSLHATYSQIPWEAFEKQAGPDLTAMFRWFQDVGYHTDIAALRQEHHGLMSFERWRNTFWPKPA